MPYRISLLLFLTLGSPAMAQIDLTPYDATYKVKISILGGELHTRLERTASGFKATHTVEATGMSRMLAHGEITETSVFDSVTDGVRPVEYFSKDTLSRDETDADIKFDWNSGDAHGVVNGLPVEFHLDGLAHDRISIQYEVMHDLLNDNASAEYTMFELDKLRPVNISVVGRKTVEVPAGTFEVIGIQHQAEGSKRSSTLWCARELGYLPVIIEQHRKGELRVRATLETYTAIPAR